MTSFGATIVAAAVWGLLGGFAHCIGMCGIFVLACNGSGDEDWKQSFPRQMTFHAGRLLSLCVLGAIAGAAGEAAGSLASNAHVQARIVLLFGMAMILVSAGVSGVVPALRIREPDVLSLAGGRPRRWYATALRSRHWSRQWLIGVFVGLLPCGLTYAFLIPAAAVGSSVKGLLVMMTFGVGTIPGLLALGLAGAAVGGRIMSTPRARVMITRLSGLTLLVLGLLFVVRGWAGR